jgi:hypothetical protein
LTLRVSVTASMVEPAGTALATSKRSSARRIQLRAVTPAKTSGPAPQLLSVNVSPVTPPW